MSIRNALPPVIVWFRDDLRLSDHPALAQAAAIHAPLICIYVLDDSRTGGRRPLGAASRWWLARSLRSLQSDLAARGQHLVLRRGAAADIIHDIAVTTGAGAVYWNRMAIVGEETIAQRLGDKLQADGIEAIACPGDLLVEPARIRNKAKGGSSPSGLRVFTPFWKRVLALGDPPSPTPAPRKLTPGPEVASDRIEDWRLEPDHPDWAGGLRASWTPGEAAAQARLSDFLGDAIAGYAEQRDRPDRDGTSRLSPHLRFGEISPRQVWHAARFAAGERPAVATPIAKFLSELGWREFSRHLLFDLPDLAERNLQPSFDAFPWRDDQPALQAWQRGLTGYPIVDAGMRQLWQTGIMHNRVRMVVASFLIKHLLIDWRHGEKWFWDTLVDADPGSNPASWQWVAGSGADAAPYFRIFNPILQGEKFDPDGAYVRHWIPELAQLPSTVIHQPWSATPLELAAAGVVLGENYPAPIVDHKAARQRALAAYAQTRI